MHEVVRSGDLNPLPLAEATTDAEGRFQLSGAAGTRFVLLAEGGGEIAASPEITVPAEVILRLAAPWRLPLRVVSARSRRPLPDASLALVSRSPFLVWHARANDQGEATFEGLAAETLVVLGSAPGHRSSANTITEEEVERLGDERIDVSLLSVGRVRGVVLDGEVPVPGATVSVVGQGASSTSDSNGRFELEATFSASDEHVEAHLGNRAGLARIGKEGTDIVVRLQDGARLRLRIVGPGPQDIRGSLALNDPEFEFVHFRIRQVDQLFEALPPGTYDLTVRAHGFVGNSMEIKLAAGDDVEREVTLAEEAETTEISGRVLDEQGRPLTEATVMAFRVLEPQERADDAPDRDLASSGSGRRVDRSGAFHLRDVIEAGYELRAEANGFLVTKARVRAPASDVQLVLRKGKTLEGLVVDAQGRPIVNATVEARPADLSYWSYLRLLEERDRRDLPAAPINEEYERNLEEHDRLDRHAEEVQRARLIEFQRQAENTSHGTAVSDATGAFGVGGLEDAIFDVRASAEGFVEATVQAKAPDKGLRIMLAPGAVLDVRVLDEDGEDIGSSYVTATLLRPTGASVKYDCSYVKHRFRFAHLPAGRYRIEASKSAHRPGKSLELQLAPGTREALTLQLERAW
ncbi:MAG: hypothetical protein HY901_33965 [Deltaproteobacteria bacterium]|nr:hypothetical protein [Deltaproteobacteria bacterium]